MEVHNYYELNSPDQFYGLFAENARDIIDKGTLSLLDKSAANGNLNCIDLLHNLALRSDDAGEEAENILFDLFSGKETSAEETVKEIQQASLKLYEIITNANKLKYISKFTSPSKLLYIAGSAMTDYSKRLETSKIFTKKNIAQSSYEQVNNDDDLWKTDRMLMTDEIYYAMKGLIQDENISVNFPVGLIHPKDDSNMLSVQILQKKEQGTFLDKTELFPVNTGDHWVLFALYKVNSNGNETTKCVIFNSLSGLKDNVKRGLGESAKMAGVDNENIIYIDRAMQENVPNGCGVFVVKVAESISNYSGENPEGAINDFIDNFSDLSPEKQMLFNIMTRRQLYKYSIEKMRPQTNVTSDTNNTASP